MVHGKMVLDIKTDERWTPKVCIKKMYKLYRKKWLFMVIYPYNLYFFIYLFFDTTHLFI